MTDVKHFDWRTAMTVSADADESLLKALDTYFQPFAQPSFDETRQSEKPMLCLKCDEPLTGMLASIFGRGGFEYGIAHGEGFCRCCGWPARAMHYVKDENGEEVVSIRHFVLQYHPDVVSKREPAEAAGA